MTTSSSRSDDFEPIAPAEAVRALVRVRYPEASWVDEITSYWFRRQWVGDDRMTPDHSAPRDPLNLYTPDPLHPDPTQISERAAVKAAIEYLRADVNAGSVRLRGELNGRVGDIDEMWCCLGNLDVFDRTLTISASAHPGAAIYRNIVCHKADVERITPRMQEADLTPEKHSLLYRLKLSNQRAACREGYQSVEEYLEARHIEELAHLEAMRANLVAEEFKDEPTMAREGSTASSEEPIGRQTGGAVARGTYAAINALWPDGIPQGLKAKERDNQVAKWLKAHGHSVPKALARAVQRVLRPRS
jgi:hypothetical protein